MKKTLFAAALALVATTAFAQVQGVSKTEIVLGTAQESKDEVVLNVVKYDGLKDVILKNRGNVVLVDFWADF